MGQFETENGVLAPTNIVIFRFVETKRRVRDILQKAKDADALVVYTLVNVKMVRAMRVAARALEVRIVDLWGQLLDEMEDHLDASRMCAPQPPCRHCRITLRVRALTYLAQPR